MTEPKMEIEVEVMTYEQLEKEYEALKQEVRDNKKRYNTAIGKCKKEINYYRQNLKEITDSSSWANATHIATKTLHKVDYDGKPNSNS